MATVVAIRRICAATTCARLSDGSRCYAIAMGRHGRYRHCEIRTSEEIIAGNKTNKGHPERQMDSARDSK